MPTIASGVHGSTFVSVNAAGAFDDGEWEEACHRMAVRDFRVKLVWSAGGSPNSAQRLRAREILGDQTEPLALVTSSVTARASLGLMSLFFENMHAFAPNQLQAALEYLEIPVDERPGVLELLARLQAELGMPVAPAVVSLRRAV